MTYEQSWKNIYNLLSLVRPIDGQHLSFEYISNFNFNILTEEGNDPEYIKNIIRHHIAEDLPFAQMYYNENGEDILSYTDMNGHWLINMTTYHLNKFGSKEGYSFEKAQKQFQELTRMAKKS